MRRAIVTSADDNFALPATVMMRSVVDHLAGIDAVDFFVLDCGLTGKSRLKMRRSIPGSWGRLHFIPIGVEKFAGFRVDGHVSAATYARLFVDKHLPPSVERAIYIDGDMVLLTDLLPLWEVDLAGHLLAAVQDPIAGRVGQSAQMMHWQGWDVPEGTPVFNGGLLVINLCKWREQRISDKAIEVARQHPDRMKYWDQCALNYVIRGDFQPLDPAWNVGPFVFYPPHNRDVVYDAETAARCIREPKIIHYGGTWRPWKGPGRHWREAEFYRYLYRTAWRNDVYCAPWMGRGNTGWTKVKRLVKRAVFRS